MRARGCRARSAVTPCARCRSPTSPFSTVRPVRPAERCWPTGGCRGCSNSLSSGVASGQRVTKSVHQTGAGGEDLVGRRVVRRRRMRSRGRHLLAALELIAQLAELVRPTCVAHLREEIVLLVLDV